LNRRKPDAVFELPDIRERLDRSPEPDQLFIVLGSPVTEVGRDHDYDWAIVEPSSVRSLIQLAGRIRRHRPGAVEQQICWCSTPT
jgi:CRISPR-associated endonuclease/helicase Cas3